MRLGDDDDNFPVLSNFQVKSLQQFLSNWTCINLLIHSRIRILSILLYIENDSKKMRKFLKFIFLLAEKTFFNFFFSTFSLILYHETKKLQNFHLTRGKKKFAKMSKSAWMTSGHTQITIGPQFTC